MKTIFRALFVVTIFLCAWVFYATFTQQPFSALVSAKILAYHTPAIAVYWYILGAGALGIISASLLLIISSIKTAATTMRLNNRIKDLERENEQLKQKPAPQPVAESYNHHEAPIQ